MLKCDNNCPNPAAYTLYRAYRKPINVCEADLLIEKSEARDGEYVVRPLTLEAHIKDYEKNKI